MTVGTARTFSWRTHSCSRSKSVDHLLPVHLAQTMTYLKLARTQQALLLNFNVARLKEGMKSFLFREREGMERGRDEVTTLER